MPRPSEQLEEEAEAARRRLSQALHELRVRVSRGSLVDQLARAGAGEFFANLGRDIRENPLAVAFFGASLALLMAPRIREAAAAAVQRGSEAVRGATERAAGQADEPASSFSAAASLRYRRGSRAANEAMRDFVALCRERPLVLAGIAFGIGAAIGGLLVSGGGAVESASPDAERLREESQEYVAAEQGRASQEIPKPGADEVQSVSSVETKAQASDAAEVSGGPE